MTIIMINRVGDWEIGFSNVKRVQWLCFIWMEYPTIPYQSTDR